ncbi:MAG TPA: hypothetical protein VIL18_08210 [Longimicrobiales bacterium]
MNVGILYDEIAGRNAAPADVRGVLEAIEAVVVALRELGHAPLTIPVGSDLDAWTGLLREARVDLVFNLCEGVGGAAAREAHVAAVVELMGLPMTGSGSETLALARRKDRVNALLAAAGLPVPAWTVVMPGSRPPEGWDRFPAIAKPAAEDASLGITQRSVARARDELGAAIEEAAPYGPVLVQEFLTGRELAVGFIGDQPLPISEIDYAAVPDGCWPLLSYRAKWDSGSDEDIATTPRCPASIGEETRRRALGLAEAAWRLVGGRGYGRVDLRADRNGNLYVLEVNPNPDIAPSAGLARMARACGWSYTEMIQRIVREAAA